MELIQGLIQPPKVQSVDETIPTLSDRAESATLIGDRRSAVLGLKAFSREYREAVIASGLKPLLNTFKRDYEDESTVKAILETLLILFIRGDGSTDLTRSWISQQSRLQNGKYPSPLVMKQELQQVDQFSLWIADAITQSDEIVHLILELLETGNFHIRLYAIQLLEALVATRPVRSRNAINSLPTGISTLVSLLDDAHEPVRDEAVLLLMAVVNDSPHVQKLVAFENIFERLFSIIDEEGGLRGSLVVNDCLSLINNILKFNTSNQSLFLETGNLPKLARVLDEPLMEEDFFWNDQRIINIKTALDIVSLTVEPGSSTTSKNQSLLLESSILMIVLRLAFYDKIPKKVRPIALLTAAGMIRGNENCQRDFGKIDVPFFNPTSPGSSLSEDAKLLPVVGLLIHWVLFANSVQAFPIRVASVELIKAYLCDNEDIQVNFLSRQIEEFKEHSKSQQNENSPGSNLLEAILDYDPDLKLNPFKIFFAADLFMFLLQKSNTANDKVRELMRHVHTGDEADGIENLSSVQTISELLTTSLTAEDIRVPISYATLLIFWIFGDQCAINEFLSERSIIQSLSSFCYQLQDDNVTIKCLVTMLLGVSYEFSSKSSPFPRKDYYEYITKTLGQDNYLSRINQLKEDPLFIKDQSIGTILIPSIDETGLPQVYFSPIFVQFFTDNNHRIKTAFLHKPEEEPLFNLSFEAFEELQNECSNIKKEISCLQEDSESKIAHLTTELKSIEKAYQSCKEQKISIEEEYSVLRKNCDEAERNLAEAASTIKHLEEVEDDLSKWKNEKMNEIKQRESKLSEFKERTSVLETDLRSIRVEKEKAENGINKMNRELLKLTKENEKLQETIKQLEKAKIKGSQDLQGKQRDLDDMSEQCKTLKGQYQKALEESGEWEAKFRSHDDLVSTLTDKLRSVAENLQTIRKERDDLLTSIESLKELHEKASAKYNEDISALSVKNSELLSVQKQNALQLDQLRQTIKEIKQKSEAKESSNSQTINDLEANMSKLNLELQSLNTEKGTLEESNSTLKNCIAKQKSLNEETNEMLLRIQDELKLSEQRLNDLSHEKNVAESAGQKQQRKLEEAIQMRKAAEEKCENKEAIVIALKSEIEGNKKTYLSNIDKCNGEVEALKEKEAQASSLVEDLKQKIDEEKQRYSKLEHELEKLKQKRTNEQEQSSKRASHLDNKIGNLKREVDELQNKLKQSTEEKTVLSEDFEAKEEKEKQLLSKLNLVKEIVEKKEAALKQLSEAKDSSVTELCQTKESLNTTKIEYESKIQELQSKLKERAKDFEAERKLLNEGSTSVTQEYSKKISVLEDKIDEAERETDKAKAQLEISQKSLAQLKSDSQRSLQGKQDTIQSLESANASLHEKVRESSQNYEKLSKNTKKESAALKAEIHALEQSTIEASEANQVLQATIDKVQGELASQVTEKVEALEEQRTRLEQKVKDLAAEKQRSEQRLQSQLDRSSKDNEAMRAELKDILGSLQEDRTVDVKDEDLKELLKRFKDRLKTSEQASVEYKDVVTEHENEISLLTKKNESLSAEISSKERELMELKTLVDAKNKEVEHVQETERSQIQKLKDQLAAYEEENKELRKKSKAESELDDLMLLVTDLDERNARYRELLRSKGIDVPSDIDDDDDYEDNEEDEDEEDDE